MKFRPTGSGVLVKVDPTPERVGSIFIPDTAHSSDTHQATVLAVGPGKNMPDGWVRPMEIQVGDRVCFHRWNLELKNGQAVGHVLEEMGPDVALVKEEDCLFIWPPDEEHTFW